MIQATTQLKTLQPRPSDQGTDAVNPGIKKCLSRDKCSQTWIKM